MTEGRSNAAAWANAVHAGTQAMRRCEAACRSLFIYVYMHLLMNEGRFFKMLNCLSDTAVPTLETGQW